MLSAPAVAGLKDKMASPSVVERLQFFNDFAGRARCGHAVHHGPKILIVGASHRPGRFLPGNIAIRVDIEKDPDIPIEIVEVSAVLGTDLPYGRDRCRVAPSRVQVGEPAIPEGGRPSHGGFLPPGDHDRRSTRLDRSGVNLHVFHRVVRAVVGDLLCGPQTSEEGE